MSLHGIREAERRLAQLEPEEPPEGLLALLKADVPAELPVHPDLKARTPAPEARAAGWLGRSTWLAAALLVMTLGGGWLALQMWSRSPRLGTEPARAPMAQAESGVEERRSKERGDDTAAGAPGASSADEVGREQDRDAEARAPLAEPAPASPPPRLAPPAEPRAPALEQEKLAAGVEGGVVGGVAGGVVGGAPGGVPGGSTAPVQVPEDFAEIVESEEQAAPARRARAEAKSEAKPAPPPAPAAAAPAPQAVYDSRDDSPLRVGGALERKRDRQENAAGGRAAAGWIERFDLRRPLAADGSGGEVQVSALPSPLVPETFWLRVEVRARQGRGADLVLTPVGGAVGLRALGHEAGRSSREGLAAGTVPGGARRLALFVAEPRGGKPSVKVSLRYRESGGEGKDLADAVGLVNLGQSPARLADAAPEDQLLVLAAELARSREAPVRRQLLEIARLADGLAAGRGGTLAARASELAGQARREAALSQR